MIDFVKGAFIPNSESLKEGYIADNKMIRSVVDANHILPIIDNFLDVVGKEPVFLFVQVPCNLQDEFDDEFHDDVYYLDGVSTLKARKIIHEFSEILINDGMVSFGVGTKSGDEIGKYKYNTILVYSKSDIKTYFNIFTKEKILENKNLILPWDLINHDNPGICDSYTSPNGQTIYDVLESLKEYGMYRVEQRESE